MRHTTELDAARVNPKIGAECNYLNQYRQPKQIRKMDVSGSCKDATHDGVESKAQVHLDY